MCLSFVGWQKLFAEQTTLNETMPTQTLLNSASVRGSKSNLKLVRFESEELASDQLLTRRNPKLRRTTTDLNPKLRRTLRNGLPWDREDEGEYLGIPNSAAEEEAKPARRVVRRSTPWFANQYLGIANSAAEVEAKPARQVVRRNTPWYANQYLGIPNSAAEDCSPNRTMDDDGIPNSAAEVEAKPARQTVRRSTPWHVKQYLGIPNSAAEDFSPNSTMDDHGLVQFSMESELEAKPARQVVRRSTPWHVKQYLGIPNSAAEDYSPNTTMDDDGVVQSSMESAGKPDEEELMFHLVPMGASSALGCLEGEVEHDAGIIYKELPAMECNAIAAWHLLCGTRCSASL